MNILDKIVQRKKEEVALAKQQVSIATLENTPAFSQASYVFADFLLDPDRSGIIAEFKRKSPSKGLINGDVSVEEVTKQYNEAGASALSVLTDRDFFGGSAEDLKAAKSLNHIPVLRKDFIVDEYQLLEAKAWGADIILLIAAILSPQQIAAYGTLAQSLGLNVLLEVHNAEELERSLCPYVNAIGVNNRNLTNFTVDIRTSFDLAEKIPNDFLKISESAISNPQTIKELKEVGFQGFLIGENFMKSQNPGEAMKEFVAHCNALQS